MNKRAIHSHPSSSCALLFFFLFFLCLSFLPSRRLIFPPFFPAIFLFFFVSCSCFLCFPVIQGSGVVPSGFFAGSCSGSGTGMWWLGKKKSRYSQILVEIMDLWHLSERLIQHSCPYDKMCFFLYTTRFHRMYKWCIDMIDTHLVLTIGHSVCTVDENYPSMMEGFLREEYFWRL